MSNSKSEEILGVLWFILAILLYSEGFEWLYIMPLLLGLLCNLFAMYLRY